jgi:2'-5' RNA ligase
MRMNQLIRCFIAVELPEKIQSILSETITDLKQTLPSDTIRWVALRNIHLTIRFLGGIPEPELSKIKSILGTICTDQQPFSIQIAGLDAFPNIHKPRVVITKIRPCRELSQLHYGIENELNHEGFEKENRVFTPHLTLGRVNDPSVLSSQPAFLDSVKNLILLPSFQVHQITFFRSILERSGARYSHLGVYPLTGDTGQ